MLVKIQTIKYFKRTISSTTLNSSAQRCPLFNNLGYIFETVLQELVHKHTRIHTHTHRFLKFCLQKIENVANLSEEDFIKYFLSDQHLFINVQALFVQGLGKDLNKTDAYDLAGERNLYVTVTV